jgi:ABC-type transporter Mla subunit MlaD
MLNDDLNDSDTGSDEILKLRLKALHRQLQETDNVDPELETLLRQLDGDIDKVLERRAEQEFDNNTYGLSSRTQELAARFNARHPTVSSGLRELGNILSNMGI